MALSDRFVWLRYRQDGEYVALRLNAISIYPKNQTERELDSGTRNNRHRFVTGRYGQYEIKIASDELFVPANRDFLVSFWYAQEQQVSFDPSDTLPDDDTFLLVDCGDGIAPEEFLESDIAFPIWTLTVSECYSRVWNSVTKTFDPVYVG